LRALRQDVETQTAINIVEGINTAETMALLGHWMRARRVPTPREASALEHLARERWSQQVRQAVALARREPGGIDQSLSLLLGTLGAAPAVPARKSAATPKAAGKPARKPAAKPKPAGKPKPRRR
jgi:hypothetical protein